MGGCARAAAHLNAAQDLADLVCGRGNGNGASARPENNTSKEAAA
jgi:hypothetical protein